MQNTYEEIVRNVYRNGYTRIPISLSRQELESSAALFERTLKTVPLGRRASLQGKLNGNPREFVGFKDISFPDQAPAPFFHYTKGFEDGFPTEGMEKFLKSASHVYDRCVESFTSVLATLEPGFGELKSRFFSDSQAARFFLMFICFPEQQGNHFPAHYDHFAITIGLHQSAGRLHIGLNDKDAKPVEYTDNQAVLYFGQAFEGISTDMPLGRHFVAASGENSQARTSIIFLATTLDSPTVANRENHQTAQRLRNYTQEGLERLLALNR
ncbi:MAG TPA: hypothetical protein VJJ52_02180 [Candidatus Nanoarchaeia archaeon]|nr:hypothetical protein [Candidatus Nanoarchaeia archaeon]